MPAFKDLELLTVPDDVAGAVADLVTRYHRHRDLYRGANYNEARLRQEFLNPFFAALGWDMDNRRGYAEPYKEVVHEDTLRVGDTARAPDYCFRLTGQPKFYVEAKAPSVNIKDAPSPAYQLRRYGWSARLPLSVLTDFEEFAIYDCREKPAPTDPPAYARVGYYTYDRYPESLAEIYSIFSHEAIPRGFFDRYAEAGRGRRGTTTVDAAFLAEIERWRDELARNLALRNQGLSVADLNFAVQAIIDRLLFLRIAEDRGIEPPNRLQSTAAGHHLYPLLCDLFHEADSKYNSGLFDFDGDQFTTALQVDDRVLKDIIGNLYYPKSPYEFSVISADILGAVYEQFLGKVIRLTKGGHAKVEEKPEVKKAGGVYYTPRYIVDYIVEHTVGAALALTPGPFPSGRGVQAAGAAAVDVPLSGAKRSGARERGRGEDAVAAPLRILDPACGSGSFLLGAYDRLLRWRLEQLLQDDPEKQLKARRPLLVRTPQGDWQLSIAERKRLLQTHIFGVDLDPQAVEVAKLNLLLKCLEGETEQSLQANRQLFAAERVLPNIDGNIKCGNSLIGPDYFTGRLEMDDEEYDRVKPFDWEREFPEIMQNGGVDCVIGNPPYVRAQTLDRQTRRYCGIHYATATSTYDIYVLFVERALRLAAAEGLVGFILPNKFFTTDYGVGLRRFLGDGPLLQRIVDFEDGQVFRGATTYTCLLFASPSAQRPSYASLGQACRTGGAAAVSSALAEEEVTDTSLSLPEDGSPWTIGSGDNHALVLGLLDRFPPLRSLRPHIFQALITGADKVFMVQVGSAEVRANAPVVSGQSLAGEAIRLERDALRQVVKGEDVQRFSINAGRGLYVVYPYAVDDERNARLLSPEEIQRRCPLVWSYLSAHRKQLEDRDRGKLRGRTDWYCFARNQNIAAFAEPKIMLPYMTNRLRVSWDPTGLFFVNITTGGYGFRCTAAEVHHHYLIGLLNSHLLDVCIRSLTNRFHGGYFAAGKAAVERLPIRPIDFSDPADVARHDRMVALVQTMLDLHRRLPDAANPKTRDSLQRRIADTDREIDQLVYELYGLTEDEIALVEGRGET